MNFKKLIYSIITITSLSLTEISADKLIVNGREIREDLIEKARDILNLKINVIEHELPYHKFVKFMEALDEYDSLVTAAESGLPVALTKKKAIEIMTQKIQ